MLTGKRYVPASFIPHKSDGDSMRLALQHPGLAATALFLLLTDMFRRTPFRRDQRLPA